MKAEQISLKESIAEVNTIKVTDKQVDGLDRLIYNHCLNKTALADFFGKSRNTFSKIVTEMQAKKIIGEPIFQNKNHLYTRFDVQMIMEELGYV